MGILDDYKEQLAIDKKNEDNSFPEDSHLKESQRKEYEKRLNELRNNTNDIENMHKKLMSEMKKMSEEEMTEQNLIKEEDIDKIIVKHAYCSECGEELISNAPPMFNPFTFERVCKHTCTKCGKIFNLDFAYPRLAFYDNKGEEIPAFTR
jgi:formylmethanofuran dehydrogenase subunit E